MISAVVEVKVQDTSRSEHKLRTGLNVTFPHIRAKSKFFLPLVLTKMLLSAKGMRKNNILTSGGNEECRKSQA